LLGIDALLAELRSESRREQQNVPFAERMFNASDTIERKSRGGGIEFGCFARFPVVEPWIERGNEG
jgi:hypothetical protein